MAGTDGRSGALLLAACALVAGLASLPAASAESRCMQRMYDFVGKQEATMKQVWGFTDCDSKETCSPTKDDYGYSAFNCVNTTDFWQVRVLGITKRPMTESNKWFEATTNCVPYRNKDEGAAKLKMGRNPGEHMASAMDAITTDSMVRVALINQHERNKDTAAAEERKCKGAHALSFYVRPSEKAIYQLPSAWVNMYTSRMWVDSHASKPWRMSLTEFRMNARELFLESTEANVQTCKDKWASFKKIFMPPVGQGKMKEDYSAWPIPPVFAKLEGHAHITKETSCSSDKDKEEWYTEPNSKYKNPYWRELIFVITPMTEDACIERVNRIAKIGGGAEMGGGGGEGKTTLLKKTWAKMVGAKKKKIPCKTGEGQAFLEMQDTDPDAPPCTPAEESKGSEEGTEAAAEKAGEGSTPNLHSHHHGKHHHHHHHHHHGKHHTEQAQAQQEKPAQAVEAAQPAQVEVDGGWVNAEEKAAAKPGDALAEALPAVEATEEAAEPVHKRHHKHHRHHEHARFKRVETIQHTDHASAENGPRDHADGYY